MVIIDTTTHDNETEHPQPSTEDDRPKKSPWRFVKWAAIAIVGAIALMYAAIFFYATVLNDAPDALDESDLSSALVENDGEVSTEPAAAPAEPADETPAAGVGFDGVWTPTDASQFGYRVDEVLSGVNVTAVGRSNEIDGSLTVEGTTASIDVTVQVANIRSDNSSRDGQFRGRIMNADEFPTATFVSTAPIEFGSIPTEGEQITATVTGDLTLRGVTRSVTFDVTAEVASVDGTDRIGVLGSIPIEFDDFDIPEPSIGSVSVEDNGLLEFVLVFDR